MSKSKHNYSQYSKKTSDPKPVNPTVPKNSSPEVKMEVNLAKESVETVTPPKTISGVVVNCAKLNVREEPSVDAEVVGVLDVMSEIMIDTTKSDNEWLKVYTTAGTEGYCMRKFVDAYL